MPNSAMETTEVLLLTVLRKFESLALELYERFLPGLPLTDKRSLVKNLREVIPNDEALSHSPLATVTRDLLAAAQSTEVMQVIVVQGLVLEQVGNAMYRILLNGHFDPPLSEIAEKILRLALKASDEICQESPKLFQAHLSGANSFEMFSARSETILSHLAPLGEAVDEVFATRFGLKFSDLIGEFTSHFIPVCIGLGMERKKVLCHLTAGLMGG